jgi:phosphatidylserine decarboxylase
MGLARGTPWLPFGLAILLILAGALLFKFTPEATSSASLCLAFGLVLLLSQLSFYRDPDRVVGRGVVSAADGTVSHVEESADGARVNVFMSPLNVHVNRAPVAGRVVSVTHHPGGHMPAFNKDSESNERVVVEWATKMGEVTTVQIAGTLARRIIPYVDTGDELAKGERFGLIRLGSRVDHILPAGCELRVRKGDKVTAGVTTIAELGGGE